MDSTRLEGVPKPSPIGRMIWLDDVRPAPFGWEWCKTAAEAMNAIADGGCVAISLDHDLGTKASGYDVALYLERRAARGQSTPRSLECHSANPIGRARIEAALASVRRLRRG